MFATQVVEVKIPAHAAALPRTKGASPFAQQPYYYVAKYPVISTAMKTVVPKDRARSDDS